jgi:beta-galactosidase
MRRTSFNDGWIVRAKGNRFAERMGTAAEWEPVTLPHDAQIGTERLPTATAATGFFPGGVWEYQKDFEVREEQADCSIAVEFEGVYRDAFVYVNGSFAGHRPYGYSGFTVPVDHLLHFGAQNQIRVEARVHDDSRWYSGAGIYRNVWLLEAERVHLASGSVRVHTPEIDDTVAVLAVSAEVRNQSGRDAHAVVKFEICDDAGDVVSRCEASMTAGQGQTVLVRQRLHVKTPRRWSLDRPQLYECRVSLLRDGALADQESSRFGIRALSLDPVHGLRINGEPTLLRGACVHHDNGLIGAATIERAEERRVELLKGAGFNAIRSAHNPMSVAMLDACDRVGMVVMDETFDMWTETKSEDDYALRFAEWWPADVEAMVAKDFNHPCVVFYSIGNEIPEVGTPRGASFGRAMAESVRSHDPTRFVTQAISGLLIGGSELFAQMSEELEALRSGEDGEAGVNTLMTNLSSVLSNLSLSPVVARKSEETLSYLDLAGYNYMEPRFEIDGRLYPERVIVATETHAPVIDSGWRAVTTHPQVIGDFTWTGWDYLGEAGIGRVEYGNPEEGGGMSSFHGDFPWLTAWCGDIDITGHRRPQSYYREIVFGLRSDPYLAVRRPQSEGLAMVHSSPWSWSDTLSSWSWDVETGSAMVVEVYAVGDEVELFLNHHSLGTRPVGPDHRFRAEFEVAFEAGLLEAVASLGGQEIGRMSLQSAAGAVLLRMSVDRPVVSASPTDLAYVDLSLVDQAGNLFSSSDRQILVELEGPGMLQGFGSADPTTEERFTDAACTSFEGRALAVIRPTGEGEITVTATADGCPAQVLRIDARP